MSWWLGFWWLSELVGKMVTWKGKAEKWRGVVGDVLKIERVFR
jgi:hypothetical protein